MRADVEIRDRPATLRPTLAELPPPPPGKSGWPWTVEHIAPVEPLPGGAEWPRISVVIPSFNQGRFIEETIRSSLLQGYPDLELMVLDGGSSDETVEVLRRYEPWLAYWVSEKDRGQTHAINKGLERATGEIFAYLNSDDVYLAGALHEAARTFAAHPEADVVHGGCVYITEAGDETFTVRGRVSGFLDYLRIWERLARHEFLTQPEVFVRRSALSRVGPFREELRSVMDFEMWLRLLAAGSRFVAVDAPLAKFRTYAAQRSSVDPGDELCRVVEEYATTGHRLSAAERESVLAELREARAHLHVRAAIAATMLDRYREAVRLCVRAARGYPAILLRYEIWAVLAHPAKRVVPPGARAALRSVLGVGRG